MNRKKRVIIPVVIVLCLALIGGGVFAVLRLNRKPVPVYEVSNFVYYADNLNTNYSYGTVTTDKLQTVYLTETQQVTQILVQPGQTVKAGDALLNFDTSLTDLQLEQKNLEIQQMQRSLQQAKDDYNDLVGYKYYKSTAFFDAPKAPQALPASGGATLRLLSEITPDDDSDVTTGENDDPDDPPEPELPSVNGEEPVNSVVKSYWRLSGAGTKEKPYLYLVADEITLEDRLPLALLAERKEDQEEVYAVFALAKDNKIDGDVVAACGICFLPKTDGGYAFSFFDTSSYLGHALGTPPKTDNNNNNGGGENNNNSGNGNNGSNTNNGGNNSNNNNSGGHTINGGNGGGTVTTTPTTPAEPTGPTAAEIAQMKQEAQQQIRDLDLAIRVAQHDLKQMQQEIGDGVVYAEVDGTVVSVGDPETAYRDNEPLVKISGGDGYYIQGAVSELKRDLLQIGQTVTVNAWYSGTSCEGIVDSISDLPADGASGYSSSDSNPNVTYYGFTVYVDASENLQANEDVDITFEVTEPEQNSDSFYLEKPFILQENGKSYVYVRTEDMLLEKREVVTGKELWGSALEICSGLTQEDWIAFPYGKSVVEGAKTEESTVDQLYNS